MVKINLQQPEGWLDMLILIVLVLEALFFLTSLNTSCVSRENCPTSFKISCLIRNIMLLVTARMSFCLVRVSSCLFTHWLCNMWPHCWWHLIGQSVQSRLHRALQSRVNNSAVRSSVSATAGSDSLPLCLLIVEPWISFPGSESGHNTPGCVLTWCESPK